MAGRRVLIVEDDEGFALALARSARSNGAEPVVVHSGRDAQALLRSEPKFDLVLADITLGDLARGGVDVLEEARAHHEEVVCFAMSGWAANDSPLVRELALRGVPVLEKPLSVDDTALLFRSARRSGATDDGIATAIEASCSRWQLSPAEKMVFARIVRGATKQQIAAALNIGTRTVEKHVQHILAKAGGRDGVAGLVRLVMDAARRPEHP